MTDLAEAGTEIQHTPAYSTFELNARGLMDFANLVRRGLGDVGAAPAGDSAVPSVASQSAGDTVALARAAEVVTRSMIVLTVTYVETFLQDILAYVEEIDPVRVATSDHKIGYAEIDGAESVSVLRAAMCQHWSKNFVQKGGPRRWLEALGTMGAKFPPPETTDVLETLWGIRHLIVHDAGIVTRDFLRHHPGRGEVGKPVRTGMGEYTEWIGVLSYVVEGTEAYVLGRIARKQARSSGGG